MQLKDVLDKDINNYFNIKKFKSNEIL